MIRSMTGYGEGEAQAGPLTARAQLRSVNGRHLELGLRLPPGLWPGEPELRGLLQGGLSRGKVDLHLGLDDGTRGAQASFDGARARAWRDALAALARDLGTGPAPGLETLLRLPGVVAGPAEGGDSAFAPGGRFDLVRAAVAAALARLVEAREREGAALARELGSLLEGALERLARIEALSLELQASFDQRLRRRLAAILESFDPSDPRLAMEAALAADRADIREEVVRFRAHVEEFGRVLGEGGACGKRLEFLCQELLREANTMGSKSPESALTQAVVGLKGVVERLKEQAMNVE